MILCVAREGRASCRWLLLSVDGSLSRIEYILIFFYCLYNYRMVNLHVIVLLL
jgi:hypothetical protein